MTADDGKDRLDRLGGNHTGDKKEETKAEGERDVLCTLGLREGDNAGRLLGTDDPTSAETAGYSHIDENFPNVMTGDAGNGEATDGKTGHDFVEVTKIMRVETTAEYPTHVEAVGDLSKILVTRAETFTTSIGVGIVDDDLDNFKSKNIDLPLVVVTLGTSTKLSKELTRFFRS